MLPCSPCTGLNLLQKTTFSFLVIATVPALQPLLLLEQQFGNPWIRSESCCCYNEKEQTSAQDVHALAPWARGPHTGCCSISKQLEAWQLHRKGCSCTVNQRAKVQIWLLNSAVLCSPQAKCWSDVTWNYRCSDSLTSFLCFRRTCPYMMHLSLKTLGKSEVLVSCLTENKSKQKIYSS